MRGAHPNNGLHLRHGLGVVLIAALAGPLAMASAAHARTVSPPPPQMTSNGHEIIARAATADLTDYCYGRESWTAGQQSGWGPDCSGLIIKSWEVPDTLYWKEEDDRYGSSCPPINNNLITNRYQAADFYAAGAYWTQPSWSTRKRGDAASHTGSFNHVVLIQIPNYPEPGRDVVYEAPSTGSKVHRTYYTYIGTWHAARRTYTTASSDHTHELDNPTAPMSGPDSVFGWRKSTSNTPYSGEDYQFAYGSDTAHVRWVPWFERTGWYSVYARYSTAGSRTAQAKYYLHSDYGDYTVTVDQRSNNGLSGWKYLGLFHFAYGYEKFNGAVDLYAPTLDGGNIVADALKFQWYGEF